MESTFNPDGVGQSNGNFFGLMTEVQSARLVLASVPWDVTVSYGEGTSEAPEAILEASTQLDLCDPQFPDVWRRGIATRPIDFSILEASRRMRSDARRVIRALEEGYEAGDEGLQRRIDRVNESCRRLNDAVYSRIKGLLGRGKLVGIVGGDHSVPFGAIRAVAEHEGPVGVLMLDAHLDLRSAYEGFRWSHASILHNVLHEVEGVEKVVLVGPRDYCEGEWRAAQQESRLHLFTGAMLMEAAFTGEAWATTCRRIVDELPDKVYLSFDIDALDVAYCPHTGTPVPGGLTFNQAAWLLGDIVQSGRRIVGFDLCEVVGNGRLDTIVGARILFKLCGATLASNP